MKIRLMWEEVSITLLPYEDSDVKICLFSQAVTRGKRKAVKLEKAQRSAAVMVMSHLFLMLVS